MLLIVICNNSSESHNFTLNRQDFVRTWRNKRNNKFLTNHKSARILMCKQAKFALFAITLGILWTHAKLYLCHSNILIQWRYGWVDGAESTSQWQNFVCNLLHEYYPFQDFPMQSSFRCLKNSICLICFVALNKFRRGGGHEWTSATLSIDISMYWKIGRLTDQPHYRQLWSIRKCRPHIRIHNEWLWKMAVVSGCHIREISFKCVWVFATRLRRLPFPIGKLWYLFATAP